MRIFNVTVPQLTVYAPAKPVGVGVLISPGGGYEELAYNLEGTEIASWLNSLGITAVLLKYRVPRRPNQPMWKAPLQDAQRAMGITRLHAREWGFDPEKIGSIGFSAGGHLTASIANSPDRIYAPVDRNDSIPCVPDFTILIYPAYIVDDTNVTDPMFPAAPTRQHPPPPVFASQTFDDPVHFENAMGYTLAASKVGVKGTELHVFPVGHHGYGMRKCVGEEVCTWPARAADWMRKRGFIPS